MAKQIAVKFRRAWDRFNAGEIAGVPAEKYQDLFEAGFIGPLDAPAEEKEPEIVKEVEPEDPGVAKALAETMDKRDPPPIKPLATVKRGK